MASPETPAKETTEFVSSNEATDTELLGEKVERGEKWVPWALSLYSMGGLCVLFIMIAIGLEVMLYESNQHQGFKTPSVSSFHISTKEASQFLKSFIPTIVFIPLLSVTRSAFLELKLLQPYITLARGGAPAQKTITADYVSQSQHDIVLSSRVHRNWGLTASSIVIMWSAVFSPLAGSLFVIRLIDVRSSTPVALAGTLGVNIASLNSRATFVAAAGNIDPGRFSSTLLPPFVFQDTIDPSQGWMIPPFYVPGLSKNASFYSDNEALVSMNTQVLNIQVECLPARASITQSGGNYSFTTSLDSECAETFTGTLNAGYPAWLGIFAVAAPSCIQSINSTAPSANMTADSSTTPVSIGFQANGTVASAAFCYGYQRVFSALATFDLRLGKVVPALQNSLLITGHELEQYAINGVSSSSGTGLALADAVINSAGKPNSTALRVDQNRQNAVLSSSDATLAKLIQSAYLEYLLVAASNIFVQSSEATQNGTMFIQEFRIHAYAPPIHALAVLCALSGFLLMYVFILHAVERRSLHLVDRPGTIGVIGAMLSPVPDTAGMVSRRASVFSTMKSPPGDDQTPSTDRSLLKFLHPNDTNKAIEEKFEKENLKFRLNSTTGAIEIDDGSSRGE